METLWTKIQKSAGNPEAALFALKTKINVFEFSSNRVASPEEECGVNELLQKILILAFEVRPK